MTAEVVLDLRSLLLEKLDALPCLKVAQCCALLNHPSHGNSGDHLIWIAQLHYLERERDLSVRYAASPDTYCARGLERAVGQQPILLSGGGQLGDLWPRLQRFIEEVVNRHQRNPIVILPQSLHFQDPGRLHAAAAILQRHPNLTLVLRDQASYQIAQNHFSGCRLLLAPDMAFALPLDALWPAPSGGDPKCRRPWLALHRGDRERSFSPWLQSLKPWQNHVVRSDWSPLERHWIWGDQRLLFSRSVATGVREILQRRLLMPRAALQRHAWLKRLPLEWQALAQRGSLHRFSLGMAHDACQQIAPRQLVISDRLHAVILASLLGVPSLAIDNHTGKVHNFLRTWSAGLPLAEAATVDQLPRRLEQEARQSGLPPFALQAAT